MAVLRFIVDVRTKDGDIDFSEVNRSIHKLVNGVFTDTQLDGDEEVTVESHIHESGRYACEVCSELPQDGVR